jgi:hypothetical protein
MPFAHAKKRGGGLSKMRRQKNELFYAIQLLSLDLR